MELMRHESIDTTLRYHMGTEAPADGRGGLRTGLAGGAFGAVTVQFT